MLKVTELRMKDIINIIDGKRLGIIKDIELDLLEGKIKSLIIPSNSRFMGIFSKSDDLAISWGQIKKVGIDVILVEVPSFTDLKHQPCDSEKKE